MKVIDGTRRVPRRAMIVGVVVIIVLLVVALRGSGSGQPKRPRQVDCTTCTILPTACFGAKQPSVPTSRSS